MASLTAKASAAFTHAHSRPGRRQRRTLPPLAVAAPERSPPARPKPDDIPNWAGEDKLSQLVNGIISNPVLFQCLKTAARFRIKSNAARKGVKWDDTMDDLERAGVKHVKEDIENKRIKYPAYYNVAFHGYKTGNLNWLCALEAEPANHHMAVVAYKNEKGLTGAAALARLRTTINITLRCFAGRYGLAEPRAVLDVGCSTGISMRWLAVEYPQAQVTGLDLSPYMLSVAELRERQWEAAQKAARQQKRGGKAAAAAPAAAPASLNADGSLLDPSQKRKRIKYVHANVERTGFADGAFDLVSVQFLVHECPASVIRCVVDEGRRMLSPGGILAVVDMNPHSIAVKNLPPALATVLKSTEPWTDEYFTFDLEGCMEQAGLRHVEYHEIDPRHRIVLGHI